MPSLLNSIPLLREAGPQAGADLEAVCEHLTLPGGEALFRVGEPADALHFLLAGALVVVRPGASGEELVGYVRSGEPVGEMALIAGGAHTASVYALRDSELVRISRGDYERLWHSHPALIQSLARRMLQRARSPMPDLHDAPPRVFALVALSPSIPIEEIARDLQSRIVGLGFSCVTLTDAESGRPAGFFETLEQQNNVVLLEARLEDSPWYRLVLRQADRIWLFARRDAKPSVPLPFMPGEQSAARKFRLVDLVYLHEGSYDAATPMEWINAAGAARFFRWRTNADGDRLARTITGRSVGIVLSGGGARAYAHVGVVRALREARVPIDFVGGTSMGAIIGAGLALDWTNEEFDQRIRESFVESNPLGDHRLPVVALTKGRLVAKRLEKHFANHLIEELPLPFYCVSTDLVAGRPFVHRHGLLREALRASISLPGVLPPIATPDRLLVDGAVLNNLPTDVMHGMHHGVTLGIDVAQQGSIDPKDFIDPPGFIAWILEHGLSAAPPIVGLLMRTATLRIDPAANRKTADILITPDLDQVELRDWQAYDRAIAAGYAATIKALAELPASTLPRLA